MEKPAQEPQDQKTEPTPPDDTLKGTPAGEPSKPGTEPSAEPKESYTREEVDKLLRASQGEKDRKIADLSGQVGRLQAVETDHKALSARMQQIEDERRKAELDAAQGDADAIDRVKRLHALEDDARKLEQRKQEVEGWLVEHEAELERANELGKRETAEGLAKEFSLTAEAILSFEAETPEGMRKVAEKLAKVGPATPGHPMPDNPAHGTPPSRDLSGKSPMELTRMAYSAEETARRTNK